MKMHGLAVTEISSLSRKHLLSFAVRELHHDKSNEHRVALRVGRSQGEGFLKCFSCRADRNGKIKDLQGRTADNALRWSHRSLALSGGSVTSEHLAGDFIRQPQSVRLEGLRCDCFSRHVADRSVLHNQRLDQIPGERDNIKRIQKGSKPLQGCTYGSGWMEDNRYDEGFSTSSATRVGSERACRGSNSLYFAQKLRQLFRAQIRTISQSFHRRATVWSSSTL